MSRFMQAKELIDSYNFNLRKYNEYDKLAGEHLRKAAQMEKVIDAMNLDADEREALGWDV